MARTKGATNKKSSNVTVVKVNTEPKEKRPPGRQKGEKIEREPAIIIPLDNDSNYRIKWDKLNKQLQVKMEKSANQNQDEIDEEDSKEGYKTLGNYTSWQFLGKRFIEELTRKNMLRKHKDGIVDINTLIDAINKAENKVVKLFGQLDVNEERIQVK